MTIEALRAGSGDCLFLSYGTPRRHVLIDGGRRGTYPTLRARLAEIATAGESLELMVVSHYDDDHIGGILAYLQDLERPLNPRDVWFNGFAQLCPLQDMNARQADELSRRIDAVGWPVNRAFDGGRIVLAAGGQPVRKVLAGGLALTLLSPDERRLDEILDDWKAGRRVAEKADVSDEPEEDGLLQSQGAKKKEVPASIGDVEALAQTADGIDRSVPNGSSIALLAEFEGRRALLAADAHPDLLQESMQRLAACGGSNQVDLVKLSHHGGAKNTTRDLLATVDCSRFLITTSGSSESHPALATIAKIVTREGASGTMLFFNYDQPWTNIWADNALRRRYGYDVVFPIGDGSLCVTV